MKRVQQDQAARHGRHRQFDRRPIFTWQRLHLDDQTNPQWFATMDTNSFRFQPPLGIYVKESPKKKKKKLHVLSLRMIGILFQTGFIHVVVVFFHQPPFCSSDSGTLKSRQTYTLQINIATEKNICPKQKSSQTTITFQGLCQFSGVQNMENASQCTFVFFSNESCEGKICECSQFWDIGMFCQS